MKIILYPFLFVFILAFAAGCGKNCSVSGKVTFPDGTPLTTGEVFFETEVFQAKGPIQSDGTYTMGSSNPGDGVPRGTYKVSIQGVVKPIIEFSEGSRTPKVTMPKTPLIDLKYTSGMNSGLTCEVKGRTKYDITVEPPK
jgi:hypothetical protein